MNLFVLWNALKWAIDILIYKTADLNIFCVHSNGITFIYVEKSALYVSSVAVGTLVGLQCHFIYFVVIFSYSKQGYLAHGPF